MRRRPPLGRLLLCLCFAPALFQIGCALTEMRPGEGLQLPPRRACNDDKDPQAVALCTAECEKERNPSSCTDLGRRYADGRGVSKDAVRAAQLYQRGCDGRDLFGCGFLGAAYAAGEGVAKDVPRAILLHERACDAGRIPSCSQLAALLESQPGGGERFTRAAALYRRACEAQDGPGCRGLGLMQQKGVAMSSDEPAALKLYEQSCDLKDGDGCLLAGELLRRGSRAVPMDMVRAVTFLRGACKAGRQTACDQLKILGEHR